MSGVAVVRWKMKRGTCLLEGRECGSLLLVLEVLECLVLLCFPSFFFSPPFVGCFFIERGEEPAR